MAILEARSLVKRFGPVTAVDHVSFEVGEGQVIGLLGPGLVPFMALLLMGWALAIVTIAVILRFGHGRQRSPSSRSRRCSTRSACCRRRCGGSPG